MKRIALILVMIAMTYGLPQGATTADTEGGGVDPSIHLLLPDNLLDSFGCLFGCAGGQNGLGGAPGSQDTATISAPLEVSALDIVKPEDLNIPGLDLDDLTSHKCNQEGCGGIGLAAIPHPESKPVIVLLGEDMTNNASEIIVLGDEQEQETLQQSGLFAGILNQLFNADPNSVLSYDVPKIDPAELETTINPQLEEVTSIQPLPELEPEVNVPSEENIVSEEEQEERQPRISSALIDDIIEENVYIQESGEATTKANEYTTVSFGTADADILGDDDEFDLEKDGFLKETNSLESRRGRKHENNPFDTKKQHTTIKVDVTHDTRLVDTDFTIEQNLVEAPRSSASDDTNINNLKGFRRPSIKLDDDFLKNEEDILKKEDDIIIIEEDIPNKEDDILKTKDVFPVTGRFKPRFGDKTFSKENSNEEEVKRFKPSKIPKFPKRIANPVKQGRAFPKRLRPTQNRANKEEDSEPIEIVSSDEPIFIEVNEENLFESNPKPSPRPVPTRNLGGWPVPSRNSGGKPVPSRNSGVKPVPSRNSGTKAVPSRKSSDRPVPSRNSGGKPVPSRNSGVKPVPSRKSGARPVPGIQSRFNKLSLKNNNARRPQNPRRYQNIQQIIEDNSDDSIEVSEKDSVEISVNTNSKQRSPRLRKFERRGRKFELFQSGCSAHMACVSFDECGKDGYVIDGLPHFHVGGRGMLQRCRMRENKGAESEGYCCRIWA